MRRRRPESAMREQFIRIFRAQGLSPICAEARAGAGRADLRVGVAVYEFKLDVRGRQKALCAVSQLLSYQTALRVEGQEITRCILVCWHADEETERITQEHGVELLIFPPVFSMPERGGIPTASLLRSLPGMTSTKLEDAVGIVLRAREIPLPGSVRMTAAHLNAALDMVLAVALAALAEEVRILSKGGEP